MAYIDNSETMKEINKAINGNAVSNLAPVSVANQVIPVMEVNPASFKKISKVYSISNTGTTTVAVDSDKDFFITGIMHTAGSSAVGVNSDFLSVTPINDTTARVISCLSLVNTALIDSSNQAVFLDFSKCPLQVVRGSNLSKSSGGTIARSQIVVFGYYE